MNNTEYMDSHATLRMTELEPKPQPLQEGVCALCSLWESCKDMEKCLISGKTFAEMFGEQNDN